MSATMRDVSTYRTPDEYLIDGYCDVSGRPHADLLTDAAVAAACELGAGLLSPQEMAFTYEALRALLPLHEGEPEARMHAVLAEALATVSRMIRQPNNKGLALWSRLCVTYIREEADIAAFMAHMQAALRLHALMTSLPPPGVWSEPDADGSAAPPWAGASSSGAPSSGAPA